MAKKKNKLKPAGSLSTKKLAPESSSSGLVPAAVVVPVMMKVCRLCEVKDGPFLDIFDLETSIAKKIDTLLPFSVLESDELPHKICFRCSAKVEELHDFVQKCIKTQESLHLQVGKKSNVTLKCKTRMVWEEKLTQINVSNDDICNAVVQKAMAGIKDPPSSTLEDVLVKKRQTTSNVTEEVPTKKSKVDVEETSARVTRNKPDVVSQTPAKESVSPEVKNNPKEKKKSLSLKRQSDQSDKTQTESSDTTETKKSEPTKPFNIMDFVTIIKVNGVGVLFQCHKCNRNFLNKEIVMSHSCAKTGYPPMEIIPNLVPPQPPKDPMASVKFINSKPSTEPVAANSVPEKPKPKIGPASRVKKTSNDIPVVGMKVSPREPTPPPVQTTAMNIPFIVKNNPTSNLPSIALPGLSTKQSYKLVPGPNNTFTLLEESATDNPVPTPVAAPESVKPKNRPGPKSRKAVVPEDTINIEDDEPPKPESKPYPVGLFHALGSQGAVKQPVPFTTPAMKKQSYTIVQTGNPSKLLISTKPQPPAPKSKSKSKDKAEVKNPADVKAADFITFVNFDSSQPSFVLPGQNSIIQESQISTSTPPAAGGSKTKNPYACSLCPETFSREKKLLAHIQNHYNKMDEETDDKVRSKRKTRNT